MTERDFLGLLAKNAGINADEADSHLKALAAVLDTLGKEMDALSIPRFGTFEPIKEDERVDIDLATGRRVLFPPSITLKFTPGGSLKYAAREKGGSR